MNESKRDHDARAGQGQRTQSPSARSGESQRGGATTQPGGRSTAGAQQSQQSQQSQQNVYGEGNYQATRDYNARTKAFIESGRVDEAARKAAPQSASEAQQMAAAEAEGKRHAKEEDPGITLPEGKVGPEDTSTPRPGKEE